MPDSREGSVGNSKIAIWIPVVGVKKGAIITGVFNLIPHLPDLIPYRNDYFAQMKFAFGPCNSQDSDAVSQLRSGNFYEKAGKYEFAIQCYTLAANQGNPEAQFRLGDFLETGKGTQPDKAQARQWYNRAADAGHAGALTRIGGIHEREGNYKAAIEYYERAADTTSSNYAEAQYRLGQLYEKGVEGVVDKDKAKDYFKLAADQGHKDAKEKLQ